MWYAYSQQYTHSSCFSFEISIGFPPLIVPQGFGGVIKKDSKLPAKEHRQSLHGSNREQATNRVNLQSDQMRDSCGSYAVGLSQRARVTRAHHNHVDGGRAVPLAWWCTLCCSVLVSRLLQQATLSTEGASFFDPVYAAYCLLLLMYCAGVVLTWTQPSVAVSSWVLTAHVMRSGVLLTWAWCSHGAHAGWQGSVQWLGCSSALLLPTVCRLFEPVSPPTILLACMDMHGYHGYMTWTSALQHLNTHPYTPV